MKLKTSFFNGYVLRKDITRFLPVWVLYSVFLALTVILGNQHNDPSECAAFAVNAIPFSAVMNCIYGFLCVGTIFGDLYVPKMCNALHAMPMRREGWFLTHFVAGILFSLIPNLVVALLSYPILHQYYYLAFVWLGASMLQFLFFYGLALFSAFCAGSRLGLVAVYGILNFLSLFIYGLLAALYMPLLKGVVLPVDIFELLCPLMRMCQGVYLFYQLNLGEPSEFILKSYPAGAWIYLYILAGVGILLAVLGLLLYKKRHLERAGDFLVFKGLTGPFLVIVSLGSGLIFYLLSQIFFNEKGSYSFLIAGMTLGFFIGKMLLDRTVRVLNVKSLLTFALLIALTVGSFFVTKMDPFGQVNRIPDEAEIDSCSMSVEYRNLDPYQAKTPEEIQEILEIHRQVIGSEPDADHTHYTIDITYHLKSGATMIRSYTLSSNSSTSDLVETIWSRWQVVFRDLDYTDYSRLAESARSFSLSFWTEESEIWNETVPDSYNCPLMDALKADMDAGNLAQGYMFHQQDMARLEFAVPAQDGWLSCSVEISADAVHTMKLIQKIAEEITSEAFS